MANCLIDTTFTGVNCASAAEVYHYHATKTCSLRIQVLLSNAAGGGDYVVYITKQLAGAGSVYTMLPKTTATAAAGELTIGFQTITIDVDNLDIVAIMVDGLAGDTSLNGTVRIWEDDYLRPNTAAQYGVDVSAGGAVGVDWANVESPTTTVGLSGTTVKAVTDGVTLAATQGAITWGQQKIVANAAGEGALHVQNTAATGNGLHATAPNYGNYNYGGVNGQRNTGVNDGQFNEGGDTGQWNEGIGAGQVNTGTGASGYGQYNTGDIGQYSKGTTNGMEVEGSSGNGIAATGGAAPLSANILDAQAIAAGAVDADALAEDAADEIADHVWDEALAGHAAAGSAGATLSGATAPTAAAVADAVWDEATSGHVASGTFGAAITNLINRIGAFTGTGVNTILGFLKAIMSKAASTPSDVGDTFAASTDSLEAIRDTISAASVTTVTAVEPDGELNITAGATFDETITGLTFSASWTKAIFTLKAPEDLERDDDDSALVQILVTNPADAAADGLQYLNKAAGTKSQASLTINQAAGTARIVISDDATAALAVAQGLKYDIKEWASSVTTVRATQTANVAATPTRSI